ncbi:MAG: TetR/AcrR family transcriptional regulator [Synechococcaceae cyanobacterium SM2_3_1]|nr:TetR/AcrR family transcriptional regulator [Synechococcaceae cyanobacterium SM2_3_1]
MRQADTKTKILDVAQALIQRSGVNGMSYQDIAEAVGIRKASVHTHFPRKDDLLIALLDRYDDRFLRVVDGILATSDSPQGKLWRYCQLYVGTLQDGEQDQVCLYAMVGAELTSLHHPLGEQVRHFYQANEDRLTQILEDGLRSGDFQFSGSPRSMAELIFSLVEGGMLITRAHGGAEKFHTIVEQLMLLLKN